MFDKPYSSRLVSKTPMAPSPPRCNQPQKDVHHRTSEEGKTETPLLRNNCSSPARSRRPYSKRYSITLFSKKYTNEGTPPSEKKSIPTTPSTSKNKQDKRSRNNIFSSASSSSRKQESGTPPYISLPTLVHTTVPHHRIHNAQKTASIIAGSVPGVSSAPRINIPSDTPVTTRKKKQSRQSSNEKSSYRKVPSLTHRHSRKSLSEPIAAALSYLKSSKSRNMKRER